MLVAFATMAETEPFVTIASQFWPEIVDLSSRWPGLIAAAEVAG